MKPFALGLLLTGVLAAPAAQPAVGGLVSQISDGQVQAPTGSSGNGATSQAASSSPHGASTVSRASSSASFTQPRTSNAVPTASTVTQAISSGSQQMAAAPTSSAPVHGTTRSKAVTRSVKSKSSYTGSPCASSISGQSKVTSLTVVTPTTADCLSSAGGTSKASAGIGTPIYLTASTSQMVASSTTYRKDTTVPSKSQSTSASSPSATPPRPQASHSPSSAQRPPVQTSAASASASTPSSSKGGSPSSQLPDTSSSAPSTAVPSSSSTCVFDLPSKYLSPYDIKSNGESSYNITVSPGSSSTISFGVPESFSGLRCTTVLAMPAHGTMQTSEYSLIGGGELIVNQGSSFTPTENSAKAVESGPCKAGETVTYTLTSTGPSLDLFEDYNPCPAGLFMTAE